MITSDTARLRAVTDMMTAVTRTDAGRHEYDGVVQDLSADGVRKALAALRGPRVGSGGRGPTQDRRQPAPADRHSERRPEAADDRGQGQGHVHNYGQGQHDHGQGRDHDHDHDQRQLAAAEQALRVRFGELELHRYDPAIHLDNLDVACYEREYAPAAERAAARRAHLAAWPEAVDAAIGVLDRVPAPLAEAGLGAARRLAGHVSALPALDAQERADRRAAEAARTVLDRLVSHLGSLAATGDPDPALGGAALARLASATEACEVDPTALAARAEAERDIWRARLTEACARIDPGAPTAEVIRRIEADRPGPEGVLDLAAELVEEAAAWTAERGLVPYLDGECLVGPTTPTQGYQVATMTGAAPYEPDGPSWFRVTLPGPDRTDERRAQWLALYNRSGLANIALHEAAPGHFSHGRALRRAAGDIRRTLQSPAFVEGWAHYCEQLAVEEGFRDGDPAFVASVARDALLRITRLTGVIGVQTGAMTQAEIRHRFAADVHLDGPAAEVAAYRLLRDPMTMSYTWGKLAILDLRDRARRQWGSRFDLGRFHASMLALGAPPLGLLGSALDHP
ncbi:DUF885 family protein [Streptomyces sp. BG9H]|uniref:DUF885 family protein n=1 Tax=Streptomyces anatolicus TaxID=2675858 RepID=A0ABS6YK64_9ACTN|nr:DUF885 family protein [Streptomyces anatolicus]MBW5421449.1 DUF885 family protein [Streptomyces anatolicus]